MKRSTTTTDFSWILELIGFIAVCMFLGQLCKAADTATQGDIEQVMQENFDASNHEDLPRLLATMSAEMPNKNMFIIQCKKEWAFSDSYYRLDNVQIVKQSKWRPPYVVATVRQTITQSDKLNDKPVGDKPAAQLTTADLNAQYAPMSKLTVAKVGTPKITVTKTSIIKD